MVGLGPTPHQEGHSVQLEQTFAQAKVHLVFSFSFCQLPEVV